MPNTGGSSTREVQVVIGLTGKTMSRNGNAKTTVDQAPEVLNLIRKVDMTNKRARCADGVSRAVGSVGGEDRNVTAAIRLTHPADRDIEVNVHPMTNSVA
jgi:hypothetical protein